MDPKVWYGAFLILDKRRGKFFEGYLNFAGLDQREEIITLDGMLCPSIFEIDDEGWNYLHNNICISDLYSDAAYTSKRMEGRDDANLLAVVLEPQVNKSAKELIQNGKFIGYDIMDVDWGISILTNCGCNKVMGSVGRNNYGLVDDFELTYSLRDENARVYEGESHSDGYVCEIWKIDQT